ncbi:MAG: Helix-turn-helix domain [Holophagaceae bacterium]|nr:Helix-turn-helix domain [Holophagaceae bacterium]
MTIDLKQKLLLKYPEACALLGIGETKLREEVKAGRIRPVKIGLRGVRIPISEIYRWLADRGGDFGGATRQEHSMVKG